MICEIDLSGGEILLKSVAVIKAMLFNKDIIG